MTPMTKALDFRREARMNERYRTILLLTLVIAVAPVFAQGVWQTITNTDVMTDRVKRSATIGIAVFARWVVAAVAVSSLFGNVLVSSVTYLPLVLVIALDRVTKLMIAKKLSLHDSIPVIPGRLDPESKPPQLRLE